MLLLLIVVKNRQIQMLYRPGECPPHMCHQHHDTTNGKILLFLFMLFGFYILHKVAHDAGKRKYSYEQN